MVKVKAVVKFNFVLLCASVLIFAGCETENVQESHGSAANLHGDNQAQTIHLQNAGGGVLKNHSPFAFFSVDATNLLVIFYPTNVQAARLFTNLVVNPVDAWLVRGQFTNWQAYEQLQKEIESAKSPDKVSIANSGRLRGQIEISKGDWRHKNLFRVDVALAGDDGLTLKGEYNSFDNSKFDPKQLWLDPYLLIFGNFTKW